MGITGVIWRFMHKIPKETWSREKAKTYYYAHPEKHRERRTRYIQNNPEKYMWSVAKQSAKIRNIPFDIVASDIIIPKHCIYLGWELTNIIGEYKGKVPTNASLDRIDSSKGYTKDNIQVISSLANKLKNNASEDILVTFAIGILKRHKNIDVSLE